MRSDLALAALACAAVPGMKPVAVAGLTVPGDEETDLQQAVVEDATGRRWLVRSPLTAVAGARLRRNDELVRQLSRHVPFKVPAPVGYAAVGRDGHAVVYPHVEGMALDLTHLPAGPGLASAVGRAVAAVHNIPRGVFEEQDVPVFDAPGCRQRLIAQVDRAAETGRVPTGLLARWEEAFDAAPLWQFVTTPVHGAFRGSTVLVAFGDEDAASGRVVAVTDWEEAMVADPAVDLAELYVRASPEAWESVLDAYTLARAQRPDTYLHARARLVAETRRLQGLTRAVTEGDQDLERRAVEALRRMDRLTEDADSLVPTTARPASSGATAVVATGPATGGTALVGGPAVLGTDPGTGAVAEHVVDPGTDPGSAPWEAPEEETSQSWPVADPDVTAEVPLLRAAAPPADPADDDLPADPADDDLRQGPAQDEPADRGTTDDGPQVRDALAEADTTDDGPPAEDDQDEADTSDDGPRVEDEPGGTDSAADEPPAADERADRDATGDGPRAEDASGAGAPVTMPRPEVIGGDDEDDLPDPTGLAGLAPEPDRTDDDPAALQDEDLQDDEERLHELYGMPATEREDR